LTKTLAALALTALASNCALAGQWNYRCGFINGPVTCTQIAEATSAYVSDEFTKKFPHNQYTVVFDVDSSFFTKEGMQIYVVMASLHKKLSVKDTNGIETPSISGHSFHGYTSQNPTLALQRDNVLKAAIAAIRDVVSDVTDK
jgi:hypothetical protein